MDILLKILLFIWELPQNLVGLVIYIIEKRKGEYSYKYRDNRTVTYWHLTSGISLGSFIFVNKWATNETIKHEFGHTKQSKMLGWLYLLVIGLPSLIWAGCFEKYRQKHNISYYSFYTERWADDLGEVVR